MSIKLQILTVAVSLRRSLNKAFTSLSMVSDGNGAVAMQPVAKAAADGKIKRVPNLVFIFNNVLTLVRNILIYVWYV